MKINPFNFFLFLNLSIDKTNIITPTKKEVIIIKNNEIYPSYSVKP